ncbi:Acetylcholine receptor subunit beta-like 1 [Folsomia candida]|uniref:Acetylcholine receptor subunit beta-like 1 n=1 Tax=Folsomia candida TaxID=158441 RepID=A0A226DR66_FOLCA|nr:Acetylcholine receptor subunit beta-like 1 [Folsomia candida]
MKIFLCVVTLTIFAACSKADEVPPKFKTREDAGVVVRGKLFDKLFATYIKENYAENTTVQDADKDVMNTNVWMKMVNSSLRFGSTNRLTWDESEFAINVLRVPAEKVWLPDITLYNGVKPSMDCAPMNVLVYPNGEVLWVPPCRLQSYCNLTLNLGPYEEQICTLKFGSWTFDGFTMGLELSNNKTLVDMKNFHNLNYKVTKNTAVREERTYDCCVEPYFNILYTLGFQRKAEVGRICEEH